jgi:hypothetical protein
MELQHLEVRLPLTVAEDFDPGEAIPVFHDWVRRQVAEEMLIDVADYRHVPGGPGIVLVGHEADYALERPARGESAGLHYRRKTALPGSNSGRLAQALGAALRAAQRIAAEPALQGRLAARLDGLRVTVNDRLLAPNTAETATALLPEIEAWFAQALGHEEFSLVWDDEPRRRFAVTLRSTQAIKAESLLERLAAAPGAAS